MRIGDKLRVVIEKEYKSMKAYAEKTGINYSQLSQYLNNARKPSIEFLERFFIEFPDVDLNWLFKEKDMLNIFCEPTEVYLTYTSPEEILKNMQVLLDRLKEKMTQ